MSEAVVQNAADKGQVRKARDKEKVIRDRELDDLKKVLATDSGRRFVWRLLARTRVFESIWRPSAEIHYLAGQQDFGHFILAEIESADQNALFQMMLENKKEKDHDGTNTKTGAGNPEAD